jgi:class 3 adenylate cyclase
MRMVCPSCNHANPARAKFCLECGARLNAGQALMVEERKVVTVLFADLVGFTSRAEQMDPEDVRAFLHEDDPERAVRAALAIRDWVRGEEGIRVRIAVSTGEALIVLGARPVEGAGMAAGDVVNSAARLQSVAPVNGILVGERTFRATRQVIQYRQVGPVAAKGKSQPIPVWEALHRDGWSRDPGTARDTDAARRA